MLFAQFFHPRLYFRNQRGARAGSASGALVIGTIAVGAVLIGIAVVSTSGSQNYPTFSPFGHRPGLPQSTSEATRQPGSNSSPSGLSVIEYRAWWDKRPSEYRPLRQALVSYGRAPTVRDLPSHIQTEDLKKHGKEYLSEKDAWSYQDPIPDDGKSYLSLAIQVHPRERSHCKIFRIRNGHREEIARGDSPALPVGGYPPSASCVYNPPPQLRIPSPRYLPGLRP
jgi:hypothetical protein